MELLGEVKDGECPSDESGLEIREACRAIVFDENNLIPLLFVAKNNYHKLPGGGIEAGESREETLLREIREETGCEIEVTGEVGQVIEFRSKWNFKQTSYCYLGKVISKSEPSFTDEELSKGFQLIWVSLAAAIARLEKDKPENYAGELIQKRDLILLKKAKEMTPLQ